MLQAYNLLIAALLLITNINHTPNCTALLVSNCITPEFRAYGINVANNAIVFGNEHMNDESISVPSSTQVVAGSVSNSSTKQPDNAIINSMKSAYTYDQLTVLFNSNLSKAGIKQQYIYNRLPVDISPTINSAIFSLNGSSINWGDIVYNDETILSPKGNEKSIDYDGETIPIHARTWFQVSNLTPNTEYHYQFVYHESGREDTIIDRTFKTLSL